MSLKLDFYKSLCEINNKIGNDKRYKSFAENVYDALKEGSEKKYEKFLEKKSGDEIAEEIAKSLKKLAQYEDFGKIGLFLGDNEKLKEHLWNLTSNYFEETREYDILDNLSKKGIFSEEELKLKIEEKIRNILDKNDTEENDIIWLRQGRRKNVKINGKDAMELYANKILKKDRITESDLNNLHTLISKGEVDIEKVKYELKNFFNKIGKNELSKMDINKLEKFIFDLHKHSIINFKNKEHRKKILETAISYMERGDWELKYKTIEFLGNLRHLGLRLYHIKEYRSTISKYIKGDEDLERKYYQYLPRRIIGTIISLNQRIVDFIRGIFSSRSE